MYLRELVSEACFQAGSYLMEHKKNGYLVIEVSEDGQVAKCRMSRSKGNRPFAYEVGNTNPVRDVIEACEKFWRTYIRWEKRYANIEKMLRYVESNDPEKLELTLDTFQLHQRF